MRPIICLEPKLSSCSLTRFNRFNQQSQRVYGTTEFALTEDTLLTMGFSYQRSDVDSPPRTGLPTRFSSGERTNLKRSINSAPDGSYNDHEQSSFFTSQPVYMGRQLRQT